MRLIVEDDIPWMRSVFIRRYPNNYDVDTTERWVRNIVLQNPLGFLAIRTDRAYLIALLNVRPWVPGEPEVSVVAFCAEEHAGMDPMRLLRFCIVWARRRNCRRFYLASETAYDLQPVAKRLGMSEAPPRYVLELYGD